MPHLEMEKYYQIVEYSLERYIVIVFSSSLLLAIAVSIANLHSQPIQPKLIIAYGHHTLTSGHALHHSKILCIKKGFLSDENIAFNIANGA